MGGGAAIPRCREASPPTHPVLSPLAESTSEPVPLQRSQSLPPSATVTLGGPSDHGSALSEREASRLDKFKQLLAEPNTDLGESLRVRGGGGCMAHACVQCALPLESPRMTGCLDSSRHALP